MKEYNLHFHSKEPCTIFVNGEMIGTINNENKFFIDLIVYSQKIFVCCNPLSNINNNIPFSFELNFEQNTLNCLNSNVEIIPFPNLNFDVVINFCKYSNLTSEQIFNETINSYNIIAILNETSTITILKNNEKLFTATTNKIENLNCETINNLLLVFGKQNSATYLITFNTETNKVLFADSFIKIEKTENEIVALKNLNNSLNHGKVFKLNLEKTELTSYLVYLDKNETIKESNLIPLQFVESIKAKDYQMALTFLSDNLNKVSNEKLSQYFSNIDGIYYNCYNLNSKIVNYTIKTNNQYKNYNFYLNNNKIYEIEEIPLKNN